MKRRYAPGGSDTLERYLVEINRYPILTLEQERELARTSRAALVTANLRFVVKVAYEYRACGFRLADLVQEGNIGLMRAVQKYDPDRGVRLLSYAAWWIRAYIQDYILRSYSLVRLGTTQAQRKLFFSLNRARRELGAGDPGTSPELDAARIASRLGVTPRDVEEMTQRMSGHDVSLDAVAADGTHPHLDDVAGAGVGQDHALSLAQEKLRLEDRIGGALATLDWRERYLIEQRVMSDRPATLQEVGDHFGISRERARQIEVRAKRKLKHELHALACELDLPAAAAPPAHERRAIA
jgi:RNA polymerase sigma-32 factor